MNKQIIGILSLLLVFLVACAPAQEAAPEKMEEKAPAEVKFGWLGALTGGAATIGEPVRDAVVLAVEEINANNVIPGKKLTIIYEDDVCDAKKSTTAVQKLTDIDQVTAIVGGLCSGTVLADAPIVEQAKVLMMSYSATNPSIKDAGDYVFRNVPSDNGQGSAAASLVNKLGFKKVGIIHIQNDYAVGLTNVFKEEAKKLGLEIVADEKYDPADTDFKTQLSKIKAASPEVLYVVSHPADAVIVLKQANELGLKVQIIGSDSMKDDAILSGAGPAVEGAILTLPGVPKSPELEKFAAAYKAKFGKEYAAYTPEAYDVVYILAKACASTDCTSTAMKDFLYTMGPYAGASGTYEFDKDGEVDKPYDFFTVKDGKWEAYVAP